MASQTNSKSAEEIIYSFALYVDRIGLIRSIKDIMNDGWNISTLGNVQIMNTKRQCLGCKCWDP